MLRTWNNFCYKRTFAVCGWVARWRENPIALWLLMNSAKESIFLSDKNWVVRGIWIENNTKNELTRSASNQNWWKYLKLKSSASNQNWWKYLKLKSSASNQNWCEVWFRVIIELIYFQVIPFFNFSISLSLSELSFS